jgi:hypothetical protein
MRRTIGFVIGVGALAISVGAFGQADLGTFPIGTTTMTYNVIAEDMSEPQTLELAVIARESGQYTVRMFTESTGTEDQLSGFGFIFGATSVAYGGEHGVSYSSLQALIDQRSRLQEGQEYLLPGGAAFTDIVGVTIAGVWALEGSFIDPDHPDTRMTVAFGLSQPVFISPRVVSEELRNGEWVEVFRLELVEYSFAEGEG